VLKCVAFTHFPCVVDVLFCALFPNFFSAGHSRHPHRRSQPHCTKNMYVRWLSCVLFSRDHISALPITCSWPSWGRLQGSRLHRPSASSYTSAVIEPKPPATMTHPPMAAYAKLLRASCIGGSGSHRSMSPSRVSTSHDAVVVEVCGFLQRLQSGRRSASTLRHRNARHSCYCLHCQLASTGDPSSGGGGSRTCAVPSKGLLTFLPTQTLRPSAKCAAVRPARTPC
jgi:hypothetical protein